MDQFLFPSTGDAAPGATPAEPAAATPPPATGNEPPVVGEQTQGVQTPVNDGVAAQPGQPQAGAGTQNTLPTGYEDLQRKAADYDRVMGEIQQALNQQRTQNEQAQRRQQMEQHLSEAIQYADRLDTDADRVAHLKRSLLGIVDSVEQESQRQIASQRQQFESQIQAQLIKGYPQYLGKQFGLSPTAVEKIATLQSPNEMTTMAQYLKAIESEYAGLRQTVEQTRAAAAANDARAQGFGAVGGVTGANPTGVGEIKQGTSEELAPVMAALLGI